jgi:hypothetical protein
VEALREKQRDLEGEVQVRDAELRRREVASEEAVQKALAKVWSP